jgi:phosphoenolpyruvate-protein kinase (PTS system EI component)
VWDIGGDVEMARASSAIEELAFLGFRALMISLVNPVELE